MPELPTGTVTFLFTDIEGSTTRWEQHREAMQVAQAPPGGCHGMRLWLNCVGSSRICRTPAVPSWNAAAFVRLAT